jgi:hypothetical protein
MRSINRKHSLGETTTKKQHVQVFGDLEDDSMGYDLCKSPFAATAHAGAPTFELLVLTFLFRCRFATEYSRVHLKLE